MKSSLISRLVLLFLLLAGGASASAEPARVGVLSPQGALEPPGIQREPFEQGLRELGWTPGSDILIEYRYAEGEINRLRELASELVQSKVDLLVVRGPQATQAARDATSTIPIVMSFTPDPVGSGFVASLARPGGNITGLSFLAGWPLDNKRLELLKEALPHIRRVAVLFNPLALLEPSSEELAVAAAALGLKVQEFEAHTASALPEVHAALGTAGTDALLVRADPHILQPHLLQVLAMAREHRLPAIYPWRLYVDAGGLMSYGANIQALHRRSATYVDKILKGAHPSDLPVQQPTTFELVVNLKTARDLGLDLPQSFLLRADEVIE